MDLAPTKEVNLLSDNWIVGNLQSAFNTWNGKLTEIWSLITTTPETFRGGAVWGTIVTINDAMKAVGYGLLVLFFAMSIFQTAASFRDFQRPEFVLRHFIRFVLAKLAVGSAMEIMTGIFSVCGGIVQTVMGNIGGMAAASITVPQEIVDAIEDVGRGIGDVARDVTGTRGYSGTPSWEPDSSARY